MARFRIAICILAVALAVAMLLVPRSSGAQFLYYSPTTVRTHGMGAVGGADPNDGANAWANPAVISTLDNIRSTLCYTAYTISSVDFSDVATTIEGGYSTLQFGVAAGLTYHSETTKTAFSSGSQDCYHVIVGAHVVMGHVGLAAGVAKKSYVLPSVADQNRASVLDIGALTVWRTRRDQGWNCDAGLGYSSMNSGDEAQTRFGPVQIVQTERYSSWLTVHGPADRRPIIGDGLVSALELSIAFDAEHGVSRSDGWRYLLGCEAAVWKMGFIRIGYVHDGILARGARDPTFGLGFQVAGAHLVGQLGYARFPELHDVYSNSFGAEVTAKW